VLVERSRLVERFRREALAEDFGGIANVDGDSNAWVPSVRGIGTTAVQAARSTSMSTNTSDRFFSVVIGLAIMAWPSIEGPAGDSASGTPDSAGKKRTPGQQSEKTRVPRSPKNSTRSTSQKVRT